MTEISDLRKRFLQLDLGNVGVEDLISVSADDEDGRERGVTGDGRQPEVESGVLVSQSRVPHEKVYGTIGQKELQQIDHSFFHPSIPAPT